MQSAACGSVRQRAVACQSAVAPIAAEAGGTLWRAIAARCTLWRGIAAEARDTLWQLQLAARCGTLWHADALAAADRAKRGIPWFDFYLTSSIFCLTKWSNKSVQSALQPAIAPKSRCSLLFQHAVAAALYIYCSRGSPRPTRTMPREIVINVCYGGYTLSDDFKTIYNNIWEFAP